MSDLILETKNLFRQFKTGGTVVNALNDINVQVPRGSLTLLRGRSGSGKTTLLNLLGALDRPTQGQIYFEGEEIAGCAERKRDELRRTKIGFIFQSVALISFMTAQENVEFGLRVAGYPAKDRARRALEVLDFVGLKGRAKHRAQEMSGGEQQRVAIARAIAHKPSIIFADEPTAELDTRMGLQVMKIFREMVERDGVTIVMTSHDPNIFELTDLSYALQDGNVVQREIYNQNFVIESSGEVIR